MIKWIPIEPGCEMPEEDDYVFLTILNTENGKRTVHRDAFYGNAVDSGERSDPNKPYTWMSCWGEYNAEIEDPDFPEFKVIAWAYPPKIEPYTGELKREL